MDGPGAILLVDDEPAQQRLTAAILTRAGWTVETAGEGEEALARINQPAAQPLAAVVIDHAMPGHAGAALVGAIRAARPELPLLMLTAQSSADSAIAAMRAGATDFLAKPIAADQLLAALTTATARDGGVQELRPLSEKLGQPLGFDEIVGSAPAFRAALAIAAKAARTRVAILIDGENGTGKEVLAAAIHAASPRARRPMVVVNCGAVPAARIDAELFGQDPSAFAGTAERRPGRFIEADGSTLFLDEIGELPAETQARLLRVLNSGEVQPLGGRPVAVDVRVIAATNRTLEDEVKKGRFREDLYYRLNVLPIVLPPLRTRTDDIPALVHYFVDAYNREFRKRVRSVSDEAMRRLQMYGWPGNVRELRNAVERAMLLVEGDELTADQFPVASAAVSRLTEAVALPASGIDLEQLERSLVVQALERSGWNQTRAAALLGLNRDQIRYRIEKFKLERPAAT